MTTEAHVASLVREYLDVTLHLETSKLFQKEHSEKGYAFAPIPIPSSSERCSTESIKEDLLTFFDRGERGKFFNLWDQYLSGTVRLSENALKIEFYTSIFFAVFPVHRYVDPSVMKLSLSSSLETFKAFLETRGVHLSKSPEFLPYYALPYLTDPSTHPTFANIFSVEWIVDLREKLTEFITQNIQITVLPQLVQLLQGHEDLKKKETQLLKKHQILQADYHNLLSIASELVGTLASSLNGQQINPEYVARILERLQIFKKGTDSTSKNGPSYLKFDQIKSILSLNEPGNEPKSIVLLHALRMRIIQQPTPQEKRQVVKTYIEYDLLQLASKKHLLTLLLHSNPILCEQFAKLLNIMTCFSCGRTYLACGEAFLIENLAQLIQTSTDTMTPLLLHSLGILEKMSLRRFVQSHLISLNIVQDCVKLLGHIEALSDVGLTYVCGLLMNLVSRNEGRKRAEEVGDAMLAAVCELLENDDPMVRAYAHGICLSLLDDFFFKDKANAIGLHELLRYLKENAPSPIAKQIEFVLEKLEHEPLDPKDWDTVSEDGEDGDFEEEIEEEDLHEELDPIQELSLGPEEIYGDSFLCEFEASDCRSQGKGGFNPGIQTLSHTQTRISNTFSISNLSHRPSSSLKQILPPVHSHSVSDFASVTPKTLLPTSTTPLSTLNPLQNQGYPTLTSSEKSYKSPKTRLQMLENELLEYEDVFKPRPRLTQTPITQLAM